jgi:hypothetical protein
VETRHSDKSGTTPDCDSGGGCRPTSGTDPGRSASPGPSQSPPSQSATPGLSVSTSLQNPPGAHDTPCQCPGPGYCERFKRDMKEPHWRICGGRTEKLTPEQCAGYRRLWQGRAAGAPPPVRKKACNSGGPGTELKLILSWWLGRREGSECGSCSDRAARMDSWGADKCEQNLDMICGWLQESAWKLGIPMVRAAFLPIVRLAIERARKIDTMSQTELAG